ncbi:hypothetical protein ACH3VR_10135 [Microbacterium sp. B2969]|uniref:Transcriptional regulator, AbiEi antitoxin, Type IV TA system n=1 Tax=Microbacterium alkaliflavum TaxID=3248839 RepID=A0ABW7Q7R4_9MICO
MDQLPLYTRTELVASGLASAEILACTESGLLKRLRPGIFTLAESWSNATPEERVVTRARALAAVSATPPLFAHETAAAIQEAPLFAPDPHRVHVILDISRPGAAAGVVRHRGEVASDEILVIDGLQCTALTRTVADMARTASFEQAVTVADALLRRACVNDRAEYDADRAAQLADDMLTIVRRSAHGQSRAKRVLGFADGRAERPGESVSRIRLVELGFRRLRLQVPVAAPRGTDYRVDLGIEDVPAWGEFDGRIKYEDGRILVDRTPDEVFDREKQREDWIRGTTGLPLVRWGWSDIKTAATLGERLAAFGIRPPQ